MKLTHLDNVIQLYSFYDDDYRVIDKSIRRNTRNSKLSCDFSTIFILINKKRIKRGLNTNLT